MQSKSRPCLENRVLDFLSSCKNENPPHLSKSTREDFHIFFQYASKSCCTPTPGAVCKCQKTCQTKSSKFILNRKRWWSEGRKRWWKIAWKLMFSNYPKAIWQIKAYGRKMTWVFSKTYYRCISLSFIRCFHFQTEPTHFWLLKMNHPTECTSNNLKSFAC